MAYPLSASAEGPGYRVLSPSLRSSKPYVLERDGSVVLIYPLHGGPLPVCMGPGEGGAETAVVSWQPLPAILVFFFFFLSSFFLFFFFLSFSFFFPLYTRPFCFLPFSIISFKCIAIPCREATGKIAYGTFDLINFFKVDRSAQRKCRRSREPIVA